MTRDTKVWSGSNDYQSRAEGVWSSYVKTSFLNKSNMTITVSGYHTLGDVISGTTAGLGSAEYALYTFSYKSPSLFNLFGGLNDTQVYSVLAVQEAKTP